MSQELPAQAETTEWTPSEGSDGLWTSNTNWSDSYVPNNNIVVISNPDTCNVTGTGNNGSRLRLGTTAPGILVLKAGAELDFVGDTGDDWAGFGVDSKGTLIVEAGATLTNNKHLYFGFGSDCEAHIYGSVTCPESIGLDKSVKGTTNVTIYQGGLLQARYVGGADNFGPGAKMDIKGGTFKFTQDQLAEVEAWIADGKIVAYGGEGTVKAALVEGQTIVTSTKDNGGTGGDNTLPVFPSVTNAGPFPTGLEAKRDDAPVDDFEAARDQDIIETQIIHEYTAYKGTPTIDGEFDDDAWKKVPWTEMQYLESEDGDIAYLHDPEFTPTSWTKEDISAWFKVLHDADNIYVLTMRIDNDIDNSGTTIDDPGSIWKNDIYQVIIDSRAPKDFEDAESPGAEIGIGHIGDEETFNFWNDDTRHNGTEPELAAGTSTSTCPGVAGKAIKYKKHAAWALGDATHDLHVMEVAIKKYDGKFTDGSAGMFSIMASDRDAGVRFKNALMWGQGIKGKDNANYASILFSGESDVPTSVNLISDVSFELNSYPNPVGNRTNVSFVLENTENVQLNVYDMSGMLVKTLVSGIQPSGRNLIEYDTSSLNNGMYLLNLRTGSGSVTTKLIK